MPLDSLPDSPAVGHEENAALLERLRDLERLLTGFGTAQPPDTSGDISESSAGEALVSPRLRPVTEVVERRVGAGTWDVADALAARVLLDELSASLRGCRTLSNAVSVRLRDTHRRLKEGRAKLDREVARRSKGGTTRRATAEIAADQGSTD